MFPPTVGEKNRPQTYPGEREEGPSPSYSVTTVPPPRPEGQMLVYHMWSSATLDQYEETVPPDVERSKEEIAAFLAIGPLRYI